jgi:hypothetical protein
MMLLCRLTADEIDEAVREWKCERHIAIQRLLCGMVPGEPYDGPVILDGDGLLGGAVLGGTHSGSTAKH